MSVSLRAYVDAADQLLYALKDLESSGFVPHRETVKSAMRIVQETTVWDIDAGYAALEDKLTEAYRAYDGKNQLLLRAQEAVEEALRISIKEEATTDG